MFNWYSERVDKVLDTGAGECWLREPDIAKLVADALQHFEGERYELRALTIMPNHVHVVVRPLSPHTLSAILKSWKGYTALHANRLLDCQGTFWQEESYDHLCRDDDDIARCCAYTLNNPVSAGLCHDPRDWPWTSHVGKK